MSARAPAATPWAIVGCGFTGEHVVARLVADGVPRERIVVTSRREDRAADLEARLGVRAAAVDPFDAGALAAVLPDGAVIVDSVPPDRERPPHAHALVAAAAPRRARRIVYLSSTGVYGRGDGARVDEDAPTQESTPRARARLAAERALFGEARAAGLEAVSLRIAAIYGPGRGVHERLRAGTYAVPGAGDNWVSRIHVADLAAVVVAAGTVEPLPRPAYVVADDEPTTARAHADGVAALLGLPPPPSMPDDPEGPDADLRLSNRRVDNRRMKTELGVTLAYPTWREGAAALLRS